MKRVVIIVGIIAAFFALRSFILPSSAPTWLRGTSPFNAMETRDERRHCIAFANMIGSINPGYAMYGDRNNGPVEVHIDRTLRVHDSLVFEGRAVRGGRSRLVFHCATANVFGNPGEHKTAATSPYPTDAEDWESANRLEEAMERQCADTAARVFPASRISNRWLVLRPIVNRSDLHGTAIDTLDDTEHDFGCVAWVNGSKSQTPFTVQFAWPTRENPGP